MATLPVSASVFLIIVSLPSRAIGSLFIFIVVSVLSDYLVPGPSRRSRDDKALLGAQLYSFPRARLESPRLRRAIGRENSGFSLRAEEF